MIETEYGLTPEIQTLEATGCEDVDVAYDGRFLIRFDRETGEPNAEDIAKVQAMLKAWREF